MYSLFRKHNYLPCGNNFPNRANTDQIFLKLNIYQEININIILCHAIKCPTNTNVLLCRDGIQPPCNANPSLMSKININTTMK